MDGWGAGVVDVEEARYDTASKEREKERLFSKSFFPYAVSNIISKQKKEEKKNSLGTKFDMSLLPNLNRRIPLDLTLHSSIP